MAAYRHGLRRDLEQAVYRHPNLKVQFVPGGHGLLFEDPEDLANRIVAFVTES